MLQQTRITASSLLNSLDPDCFEGPWRLRMSEDSTKLSTILHWISIVISPVDTAVSLSCNASSGRLTFYLSSNSFHSDATSNATRLLNIMRQSLLIASTGGNLSDLEDDYMAFVNDGCWYRLLDKVNNKVPRFQDVPDRADVSTMSSVLETIIGLTDAWNAWRLSAGLSDEASPKIMKMKQTLNHSQSIDTLKHCFEQASRPLDDSGDHLQQLRCLWSCCYALMKSDFFADIFGEKWRSEFSPETQFLFRIYRRIWRLYSFRRGIDILLYGDLLPTIQGCCPNPPEMTFCWIPRESSSTTQMVTTPQQYVSQLGQRWGWRGWGKGDLALDSPLMSQAHCLWSMDEIKTINVHSMVSLANFLHSSGTRVMENRIGTNGRPCALCDYYLSDLQWDFFWQYARTSGKYRVDWAIPKSLDRVFTREYVVEFISGIADDVEQKAGLVFVPNIF